MTDRSTTRSAGSAAGFLSGSLYCKAASQVARWRGGQWRRACRLAAVLAPAALIGAASPQRPATLTVFAAASLSDAFRELGDSLRRRHDDVAIEFNFAGSQMLALQIQHGAGADVFASADTRWMKHVRDAGLVAGDPRTFTHNHLVVIVPRSNPGRIHALGDLARSGVKLVLAAEAVPAGRYARRAIDQLARAEGFPPRFAERVLANVVSNEDNVRSVATKVQLGEADAGIVYVSDVTPALAQHVRRIAIPIACNVVASYPIALLRRAPQPVLARAFIDLVLAPAGRQVLARHGFVAIEVTADGTAH